MKNNRAQREALRRLNFAFERLASLPPEGRQSLTIERLMASYGVTATDAARLVSQFAWRG